MSDTFGEFIPILRTLDVVRQDSGQRDCLYSFNQTSEFDDGSPLWGRSRGAVGKRHRRPVAVALEVLLESAAAQDPLAGLEGWEDCKPSPTLSGRKL